ncbi:MAG: glycoside hydrolase family 18 protein, partial [Burkholderiales bacterium]
KFAGVDIDWEPNGNNWTEAGPGQLTKIDLTNYLTFLQELKLELTRAKDKGQIGNDILRIAITANPEVLATVDRTYGNKYWAAVANTVNSIDLMTYDYHGADFDAGVGYTNFNSPLYYDPAQPSAFGNSAKLFNTNASIIQMMNYAGVPATKLIIGVPAYGRAYRLTAFNTQTPYIAYDTQELVPGPRQDSLYTYREIMLTKSNNQKSTNTDFNFKTNYYSAGQAYAVGNYSSNNSNYPVFISYDNFITAQNKMKFVAQNQLAGVIIWS